MEEKVVINEKEYLVKEILYIEAISMGDTDKKAEIARLMLKGCVGLTDEEIDKLTLKEGLELQKAIDRINVLDFQQATEKKE